MKALIIEPERDCQNLVPALEDAGFQTVEILESSESAKAVLDLRPQLIVVDEEMPPAEGAELVPMLRGLIESAIITLGNGDEEVLAWNLFQGADCYMSKPVNLREFMARSRVLLRRYSASWNDRGEPLLNCRVWKKGLEGRSTATSWNQKQGNRVCP